MHQFTFKTFDSFIEHVGNYNSEITIYRGVTHEKYDLRPRIGRVIIKESETLLAVEKRMLFRFVERSVPDSVLN